MKDVIVIGAGMAGVTAARELTRAGFSVTVLEARDRIGGRVHSIRDFSEQPIEAGAEFIHGSNATTRPIAEAAGLNLVKCPLMRHTLYNIGRSTHWLPLVGINPRVWPTATILHKLAQSEATDLSARQFIEQQGYKGDAKILAEMTLSAHLPGTVDDIGVGGLREDGVLNIDTAMNRRVDAGYDSLPMHIAHGLDITMNFVIDEIKWGSNGVTVISNDGREVSAKTAVSTLPVGVLKSGAIKFTPGLPKSKEIALEKIVMGPVLKVLLEFKERFWPKWTANILSATGTVTMYWPTAYHRSKDLPILTAYSTGPRAAKLGSVSEEEATDIVLADLQRLFPKANTKQMFVKSRRIDWAADPFACGGYTYLKPGGTGARALLAAADTGPLFWAGSATMWSPVAATVEAAHNSGIRVAKEVTMALKGMSSQEVEEEKSTAAC